MSILINGLIKWREEKMERAETGLKSQWLRGNGEGWESKWVKVRKMTTREVRCGVKFPYVLE